MKMWIARDLFGGLYLYSNKPIKMVGYNCWDGEDWYKINRDFFPEVTFENSPMEVELKLIENGTDELLLKDFGIKKFDVTTLHYFDTVLVRNDMLDLWEIDFFSKLSNYSNSVVCNYDTWKQCIPYNDETKHLVGTEEDCPKYYKWWEE